MPPSRRKIAPNGQRKRVCFPIHETSIPKAAAKTISQKKSQLLVCCEIRTHFGSAGRWPSQRQPVSFKIRFASAFRIRAGASRARGR